MPAAYCANCGELYEHLRYKHLQLCEACLTKFSRAVVKSNTPKPPKVRTPRPHKPSPFEARNAEMRRERIVEGKSLEEIGQKHGLTRERVRQLVGPCAMNTASARKNKRQVEIVERTRQGQTVKEIAVAMEIRENTVFHLRSEVLGKRKLKAERMESGLLLCTTCSKEKGLDQFSPYAKRKGITAMCRPCQAATRKRWYWRKVHGTEPPAGDGRKLRKAKP